MELRQLEAFFTVMGTGSVTAAGLKLNRSQSVITRLIQDLEAELGYTLFERRGPRINPTNRAFLLYEEVEQTLVSVRHLQERAAKIADNEGAQTVRLISIQALAAGLLPDALKTLAAADMPAQISIKGAPAEQVVHAVLARSVDIGLASLPIEHPGLDVHWIAEVPLVAVVASGNPMAKQDTLSLADLRGQKLITVSNPNRLKGRIDATLRAHGVDQTAFIETNSSLNAVLAARADLGVALVEGTTLVSGAIDGVKVLSLDAYVPFFFSVITPIAKPATKTVEKVLAALRETALAQGFTLHEASAHQALTQRYEIPASTSLSADRPALADDALDTDIDVAVTPDVTLGDASPQA
ncbi:LysR family transcriptional regulator [Robbsia sp. KACC 23696]|uniref:LysR family transcriptional regulator n=1 Tax=Robbsia sp. KACC 23696 TaxID=3149231 RepID=UPI00325AD38B